MLLAGIIIAFTALAFGLLAWLDHYVSAAIKVQADRRTKGDPEFTYYNAFADRNNPRPAAKPGNPELLA
jgi:hypothetical protein